MKNKQADATADHVENKPSARFRHCPSYFTLLILILFAQMALADGVVATLKNPTTVTRSDARSGSFLGSISVSKAVSVGCDGATIAVLSDNGNVSRYDAKTGSFQGSISAGSNATSVQVSSGVIVVTRDRMLARYDARTGSFLGSSSQ